MAHRRPQATTVHPTATRKAFADRDSTAKLVVLAKASVSGFRIANAAPRKDIIDSDAGILKPVLGLKRPRLGG